MHVESFGPGLRYNLDKILVACKVFGQNDKMAACVFFVDLLVERFERDIHLASHDSLELLVFFALGVDFLDVVGELLDAEHIAVVGDGDARHSVGYSLVNQVFDGRLTVEKGVLCVDVEMYEWIHG